jgi:hypothetical protein
MKTQMTKPKLIVYQSPYQSESLFHSVWFQDIVRQYFDLEHYSLDRQYDPDAIFVIGARQYLIKEVRDEFRDRWVIVDSTWESNTGKYANLRTDRGARHIIMYGNQKNFEGDGFLFVTKFFWFNECLWYRHRGYQGYSPNKTYTKKFLMPIGTARGWRDETIKALTPWLEESYWSCVKQGQYLPGTKSAKGYDHRYMNPAWYDDTYFSVVCESARSWEEAVVFVTEKTYKVFAGQHPFMVIGAAGILDELKSQGFETFDNVFDETYNQESDLYRKLDIIKQNIEQFKYVVYDAETQRRIQHNFDRFYNAELVLELMRNDIFNPLLEWINRAQ